VEWAREVVGKVVGRESWGRCPKPANDCRIDRAQHIYTICI
jgi:hypothetical protein